MRIQANQRMVFPCLAIRIGLLVMACLGLGSEHHAAGADEAGFESLFDGKTLAGWEGNYEQFRIQEGAIVAGDLQHPIPHNEFLCTTREFDDFELRLKFQLVGKGANAGVQFRSQRSPNHHEVSGYQADLGEGWWGSLYDESRRDRILVAADKSLIARILRPEDWNDYTIRCEGTRIRLWINGHQTVDYNEQDETISRIGILGLQIHGGPPSVVRYKDLRIKKL